MIDDHEIAMFLGSDGKIKLSEIPSLLMTTEVGQWGSNLRYRPSYYTMRIVESALWRDNANLWYGARYTILVLSMVLGFTILSIYFPQIISYFFVFYVMTMPFWPDILTRLGPSETYAMFTVLIFVYGIIKNNLSLITIGYIISVGSKENLIVLLPILYFWIFHKYLTKKLTRNEIIMTGILTIYTLFIAGSILVATGKSGSDFYKTDISYRYRITRFVWDIPKIVMARHMIPSLIIMIIAMGVTIRIWFLEGWRKLLASKIAQQVFIMVIILTIIASQFIFYINQLPSNMRYDFPVMPLFPIVDLIAILITLELFKKHKYFKVIKNTIFALMIVVFGFYIYHRGYTTIQTLSKTNASNTQYFERELKTASEIIKNNSDATIMFVSDRYFSFEPVVSVSRHLNSRKINNKYSLYYTPEINVTDPLGLELQDRLIKAMNTVKSENLFSRFSKFEGFHTPCYSLIFGDATPLPECPTIAKF